jgi:hypothetical protein
MNYQKERENSLKIVIFVLCIYQILVFKQVVEKNILMKSQEKVIVSAAKLRKILN